MNGKLLIIFLVFVITSACSRKITDTTITTSGNRIVYFYPELQPGEGIQNLSPVSVKCFKDGIEQTYQTCPELSTIDLSLAPKKEVQSPPGAVEVVIPNSEGAITVNLERGESWDNISDSKRKELAEDKVSCSSGYELSFQGKCVVNETLVVSGNFPPNTLPICGGELIVKRDYSCINSVTGSLVTDSSCVDPNETMVYKSPAGNKNHTDINGDTYKLSCDLGETESQGVIIGVISCSSGRVQLNNNCVTANYSLNLPSFEANNLSICEGTRTVSRTPTCTETNTNQIVDNSLCDLTGVQLTEVQNSPPGYIDEKNPSGDTVRYYCGSGDSNKTFTTLVSCGEGRYSTGSTCVPITYTAQKTGQAPVNNLEPCDGEREVEVSWRCLQDHDGAIVSNSLCTPITETQTILSPWGYKDITTSEGDEFKYTCGQGQIVSDVLEPSIQLIKCGTNRERVEKECHSSLTGTLKPIRFKLEVKAVSGNTFQLMMNSVGLDSVGLNIDWGDGDVQTIPHQATYYGQFYGVAHTYSSVGEYIVTVEPSKGTIMPIISFKGINSFYNSVKEFEFGDYLIHSLNNFMSGASQIVEFKPGAKPNFAKNAQMDSAFSCHSSANKIVNADISSWDVSKVKNMSSLFYNCDNVTSDITNWDTSNVSDLSYAFNGLKEFNQDISNWDTRNVKNLMATFSGIRDFNQPIGKWKLPKLETLYQTFSYAKNFNQDLSGWDLPKLKDTYQTFSYAEKFDSPVFKVGPSVTNIEGVFMLTSFNQNLSHWDTSNVTNMRNAFYGAKKFNQNINSWDVTKVNVAESMFSETLEFNQDLSSWDLSNATIVTSMFDGAKKFNKPIAWNLSKASNLNYFFRNAVAFNSQINGLKAPVANTAEGFLEGASSFNQEIEGIELPNVSNIANFFKNAINFNKPVSGLVGNKITNITSVFEGATNFNRPVSDWDVSRVNGCRNLFKNATAFNSSVSWGDFSCYMLNNMFENATNFNQPLSNWSLTASSGYLYLDGFLKNASSYNKPFINIDESKYLVSLREAFLNATSFNAPINPNLRLNSSQSANSTFRGATSFNQDISNWDVSRVVYFDSMFQGATEFNGDLSSWNMSNATSIQRMFADATKFNSDISGWDLTKVNNISELFLNASSFNQDISQWRGGDFCLVAGASSAFNGSGIAFDLSTWKIYHYSSVSFDTPFPVGGEPRVFNNQSQCLSN